MNKKTKPGPGTDNDVTPPKPRITKRHIPASSESSDSPESSDFSDHNDDTSYVDSNLRKKKKVRKISDSGGDSDHAKTKVQGKEEACEFLNTASENELACVPLCSTRKAVVIAENRPYRNWYDVNLKFSTVNGLNSEILDTVEKYIEQRQTVKDIVHSCKTISERLQRSIAENDEITIKPSLLEKK
jgi:SWI/SNF-related matrix-associated actin-dependent regulator 1 of chromatin subfamily A